MIIIFDKQHQFNLRRQVKSRVAATSSRFTNILLARLYPFFGNTQADAETFVGQ
ncbi:hypothetical protein [Nostoc sp.]|uniref:hypothetical protein n=1 Tax=Nostoc sp. TaxID=1180 RepID=UPI002FF09F94